MSYAINGTQVTEEEFFRHTLGDRLADLMLDAGYSPITEGTSYETTAKAIRWKKGARGVNRDLSNHFPPVAVTAEHLHIATPSFTDSPAFIHGRVNALSPEDRDRVSEGYREGYEKIRKEYSRKNEESIPPSSLGGLRALRQTVREELDHRARRAAGYTNRIPQYLAVLLIETSWRFRDEVGSKHPSRIYMWMEQLWGRISHGHYSHRVLQTYDSLAEEWQSSPDGDDLQYLWEAQRDVIENLLYAREEELNIAEKLEYRYHACRLLLRAAATGDKIRPWDQLHHWGHLDTLVRLGYHLRKDSVKRLSREHQAVRTGKPVETEADYGASLDALCIWAEDRLGLGASAIQKAVLASDHWDRPGKGNVDRDAVDRLIYRLIELSRRHDLRRE